MKRFIALLIAVLSLCISAMAQIDSPTWDELQKLPGKGGMDDEVKQFILKYKFRIADRKFNCGKLENKRLPITIEFCDVIKTLRIHLWNVSSQENEPTYKGDLPFGLEAGDSPEEVRRKLGSPYPPSNESSLSYAERGLTFQFHNRRLYEIEIQATKKEIALNKKTIYDLLNKKEINSRLQSFIDDLNAQLPKGWNAAKRNLSDDSNEEDIIISYAYPVLIDLNYKDPLPNSHPFEKDRVKKPSMGNFMFSIKVITNPSFSFNTVAYSYKDCLLQVPYCICGNILDDEFSVQADGVLKTTKSLLKEDGASQEWIKDYVKLFFEEKAQALKNDNVKNALKIELPKTSIEFNSHWEAICWLQKELSRAGSPVRLKYIVTPDYEKNKMTFNICMNDDQGKTAGEFLMMLLAHLDFTIDGDTIVLAPLDVSFCPAN